jgi:hypothetical protein
MSSSSPAPQRIHDLLAEPETAIQWVIDPYIPACGIILLYGKYSTGKSPLTWHMGQSVSAGVPFFGCPTTQGPVLYIELDSPKRLVKPRLQKLAFVPDSFWWLDLYPGIDLLRPTPELVSVLKHANATIKPILVIINTLRKIHTLSDKDSEVPSRVYQALHRFFPKSAILVTHHDKKTYKHKDIETDEDEAFSGSQAWLNDAQVGLHLVTADRDERTVRLVHTKSQVSELVPSLHLRLSADGTNLVESGRSAIWQLWNQLDPVLSTEARVQDIVSRLHVSRRTVFRAIRQCSATQSADRDT